MLVDSQQLLFSTFLRGHGPRYASRTSSSPSKPVRPLLESRTHSIYGSRWTLSNPEAGPWVIIRGFIGGEWGVTELKTPALDRLLEALSPALSAELDRL